MVHMANDINIHILFIYLFFYKSLHVASLQLVEILLCNKAVLEKIKDMKTKLNIT